MGCTGPTTRPLSNLWQAMSLLEISDVFAASVRVLPPHPRPIRRVFPRPVFCRRQDTRDMLRARETLRASGGVAAQVGAGSGGVW